MFEHCNRKFRANETQFLYSNENFTHRKLKIGECPECGVLLARLIETRILDGKKFDTLFTRKKAEKIIRECSCSVDYTSLDIIKPKDSVYGFVYGENKEKISKNGKRTITQKACDFYGNKEVIKVF